MPIFMVTIYIGSCIALRNVGAVDYVNKGGVGDLNSAIKKTKKMVGHTTDNNWISYMYHGEVIEND
jgi:hypothetical protein